jgi:hypothetical protein
VNDDGAEAIRRLLRPYPSVQLSLNSTPIRALARLSARLGRGPRVWIMRDDLTGFALGGNKIRKLEYLVAGQARAGELDDTANVLLIHTGGNAGAYY